MLSKLLTLQQHQQQQMHKQLEAERMTTSTPLEITGPLMSVMIHENKTEVLLPEQREDNERRQAVLKGLVGGAEKEEKKSYQKKKRNEIVIKRQTRATIVNLQAETSATTAKLQALLMKHTELLRKEVLRKKFLMEKEVEKMIMMGIEVPDEDMIKMDSQVVSSAIVVPEDKQQVKGQYRLFQHVQVKSSSGTRDIYRRLTRRQRMAYVKKNQLKQRSEQSTSNGLPTKKTSSKKVLRKRISKSIELLELESDPLENGFKGPFDLKRIKSEACEDGIETGMLDQTNPQLTCKAFINGDQSCICSCPFNKCSSSASDLASCFDADEFENLLMVIKYLNDHAREDDYDTAEKYYTFKLQSLSRSQQMLARNLINEVLVQAEKGNLNGSVGLFQSLDEEQEQKEVDIETNVTQNESHNPLTEGRQTENNLQLPERCYLCPVKNKIFDKMHESLLMCMKQDRLTKSYAARLRLLSTIQYSFADKLINEILFEADFGRLTCSSELQLSYVLKSEMKHNPVIAFRKKPLKSVISKKFYASRKYYFM